MYGRGDWNVGANWTLSWLAPLAGLEATLWRATKDGGHLEKYREILLFLCDTREELASLIKNGGAGEHVKWARENGYPDDPELYPVTETCFSFTSVLKTLYFTGTDIFSEEEYVRIESLCHAEISVIFTDREWGRHNRAALRAIALLLFGRVFKNHPDAEKALAYSRELIGDSLGFYSIEDAGGYLAVWLTCLIEYYQIEDAWDHNAEQVLGYYARFFASMMMPNGGFPEFGDSKFDSQDAVSFLSLIELVAGRQCDGKLVHAANMIFKHVSEDLTLSASGIAERGLANIIEWAGLGTEPVEYEPRSMELLDEEIGKKFIFRGWSYQMRTSAFDTARPCIRGGPEKERTYLLYNYRDMPRSGYLTRKYLTETIAVHAEKPHHGHADEQSVAALCFGNTVLLRDSGYRDHFTADGHYRADFYHNRMVLRNGRMLGESGFLEYARDIGTFLPVETERIFYKDFSFGTAIRTRLVDRFRRADADRHIVYLKDENIFVVVDTARAWEASELTAGVMYHAERIDKISHGVYRVYGEFGDEADLLIAFAFKDRPFSVEEQRRNYRRESALSQYASRFFRANGFLSFVSVLIPETGKTPDERARSRERAAEIASSLDASELIRGECLYVSLIAGDKKYEIGVKCDETRGVTDAHRRPAYGYEAGKARFGVYETDALFFITDGRSYGAVDFTRVEADGVTVFTTPETMFCQLDFIETTKANGSWGFHEGLLP